MWDEEAGECESVWKTKRKRVGEIGSGGRRFYVSHWWTHELQCTVIDDGNACYGQGRRLYDIE